MDGLTVTDKNKTAQLQTLQRMQSSTHKWLDGEIEK